MIANRKRLFHESHSRELNTVTLQGFRMIGIKPQRLLQRLYAIHAVCRVVARLRKRDVAISTLRIELERLLGGNTAFRQMLCHNGTGAPDITDIYCRIDKQPKVMRRAQQTPRRGVAGIARDYVVQNLDRLVDISKPAGPNEVLRP